MFAINAGYLEQNLISTQAQWIAWCLSVKKTIGPNCKKNIVNISNAFVIRGRHDELPGTGVFQATLFYWRAPWEHITFHVMGGPRQRTFRRVVHDDVKSNARLQLSALLEGYQFNGKCTCMDMSCAYGIIKLLWFDNRIIIFWYIHSYHSSFFTERKAFLSIIRHCVLKQKGFEIHHQT